jgi:hypothetical protein
VLKNIEKRHEIGAFVKSCNTLGVEAVYDPIQTGARLCRCITVWLDSNHPGTCLPLDEGSERSRRAAYVEKQPGAPNMQENVGMRVVPIDMTASDHSP